MIIIRCHRTSHEFTYDGNITLDLNDYPFLTVTASGYQYSPKDSLPLCYEVVIDRFWPQDIISIRGEE